ncbi:MAG: hypothetical protein CMI30_13460, partial [Opitutae bacterium]|nr:hypothetical protein [Opitutae bacterium]
REAGCEETEEEKGASYGSHDMVNCFWLKLGQGIARINRKPDDAIPLAGGDAESRQRPLTFP